LVYRTLFYINIYGSYKLSKNSPVFGPSCITLTTSQNNFPRHFQL